MAKRTVIDCDRCAKETSTPGSFWITVGYSSCPAGGSGSNDDEEIDLCPNCMVGLINHLKKLFLADYDQGKKIVQWVKDGKKGK